MSGLVVYDGGLMTISGNDTTIHHNCTDGKSYHHGLDSSSCKLIDENSDKTSLVGAVVVATDQDTKAPWRGLKYTIIDGEVPQCDGLVF